jgi:hypothetical protein
MDLCYDSHPLAARMDRPLGVPEPQRCRRCGRPAGDDSVCRVHCAVEEVKARHRKRRLAKVNVPLAERVDSQAARWGQAFRSVQDRHERRVAERLRGWRTATA